MAGLRRTEVGLLTLQDAVPLQELTAGNLPGRLQPMDVVVGHLPVLRLARNEAQRLSQGQWIGGGEGEPDADLVRVYDEAEKFVGIAASARNGWRPSKIFYKEAP